MVECLYFDANGRLLHLAGRIWDWPAARCVDLQADRSGRSPGNRWPRSPRCSRPAAKKVSGSGMPTPPGRPGIASRHERETPHVLQWELQSSLDARIRQRWQKFCAKMLSASKLISMWRFWLGCLGKGHDGVEAPSFGWRETLVIVKWKTLRGIPHILIVIYFLFVVGSTANFGWAASFCLLVKKNPIYNNQTMQYNHPSSCGITFMSATYPFLIPVSCCLHHIFVA